MASRFWSKQRADDARHCDPRRLEGQCLSTEESAKEGAHRAQRPVSTENLEFAGVEPLAAAHGARVDVDVAREACNLNELAFTSASRAARPLGVVALAVLGLGTELFDRGPAEDSVELAGIEPNTGARVAPVDLDVVELHAAQRPFALDAFHTGRPRLYRTWPGPRHSERGSPRARGQGPAAGRASGSGRKAFGMNEFN